jgi:hypothetical protein
MTYQVCCDGYVDERDGDIQVLCEIVQSRKVDTAGDGGYDGRGRDQENNEDLFAFW